MYRLRNAANITYDRLCGQVTYNLYENHRNYCIDIVNNIEINHISCPGGECADENACCNSNCVANELDGLANNNPTCYDAPLSGVVFLDTSVGLCNAFCDLNRTFPPKEVCAGGDNGDECN